ncbi:hypothetical protein JCM31271_31550 [Halorubrum trueperi]
MSIETAVRRVSIGLTRGARPVTVVATPFGSVRFATKRWLRRFKHYYNRDRSNQALDGCTPAEEVLN